MPLPGSNVNVMDLKAGHADGKSLSPEEAAAALNAAAELAAKLTKVNGATEAGNGDKKDQSATDALKKIGEAAAALKPANGGSDREALADPYAVLAKLEQDYVSTQPTSVDVITGDPHAAGAPGGEVDRDPFDPSYWQVVPLPAAKSGKTGAPGTNQAAPNEGKPDAAAFASGAAQPPVAVTGPVADAEGAADTARAKTEEYSRKPEATVKAGQEKGEATDVATTILAQSTAIAQGIKASIAPMMADAAPDLAVTATNEGVTIDLTDAADYSMFGIGSAVPAAKTVVLIERIAKVLAGQPGRIVVRGHTDGRPFHSADYDNWRLSTARAQMAYYTLLRGGLEESRVVAIEGHADRDLKNPADPYAAENRRIEILVKDQP
jgi:chemotaxis protein MotB